MVNDALVERPQRYVRERAIERRPASGVSYEMFLEEYAAPGRPVILEDSVPHWRALRAWTPDFFASTHGDKVVQVNDELSMALRDFVAAVRDSTPQSPGPYLHKLIIHRDMPELLPDVTPGNRFGFPGRLASPLMPKPWNRPDGYLKLLFGGPGGRFPYPHYDGDNAYAVITEIYGTKEFLLFAPDDARNMYPKPHAPNVSLLPNLLDVDLTEFPRYALTTPYRGSIGPGDAIFIPNRWWHSAHVSEVSISVCTNMITPVNWRGFVNEACRPQPGRHPARQLMKRMYLGAVGGVLSGVEAARRAAPHANGGGLLARLAPRYDDGAATGPAREGS